MSFLSTFGHALKSKTVWGAVALGAVNTLPMVAPYVQGTPLGLGVNLALAGFTIYGRIRAKQPLGSVVDDTIAQTIEAVHVIGTQSNTSSGATVTTLPAPQGNYGKVQQLAEVTALVKSGAPKF